MKKSLIYYCLIFVSLCILVAFFPTIGIDITWSLKNLHDLQGVLAIKDTGLIAGTLTALFIKYKLLKIMTISLFMTLLISIIKTTINKKNDVLALIMFFMFFLLDRSTFAQVFISTHGFATIMTGILGILLLNRLFIKNTIQKMNPIVLIVLGVILSNLEPSFAITACLLTVIYTITKFKDDKKTLFLLIPEVLGLVYSLSRHELAYDGFSNTLIHSFMPAICGQNFIITLVLSAIVLILSIKVFTEGHKLGATLSILGVGLFLFSSLLSTNDYLNYISFLFYNISAFYILLELTRSHLFKRKISIYFISKVIYIIVLCSVGTIDYGTTFFPFVIDMVLILELYNQILPNDFLTPMWITCALFIIGVNIYTYKGVYTKYGEMNFYIKNKLECTKEDIVLPSKYDTDYLLDYIPKGKNRVDEYIEFYGIDVYDKDKTIDIEFRKSG